MSKYYKAEDIDNAIREAHAEAESNEIGEAMFLLHCVVSDLPTIEVEGGDLEDAILLTKDAYSDLCLRAAQFSDKAECDNCIWDICNYNKIDWEVSKDCISRSALRKEMEMYGAEITLIDVAPSVVPTTEQSSMVGKWIKDDNETYICSACGSGYKDQPTCVGKPMFAYCPICGAKMKGTDE